MEDQLKKHTLTVENSDFFSKSLVEQNNSFLIADLDISKLDAKRQVELAALLENKDKLILEKSEQHKEILQDYQSLRDQYIIKQTELERTNKALADQKAEILDYREKMKAQHEDIVSKLKATEEAVKELANYLTSVTKYTVFAFSQAVGAFSEAQNNNTVINLVDGFEPFSRDLERAVKPIQDRHKKNPKRILSFLEEVKQSYTYLKDKIQPVVLSNAFESLLAHMNSNLSTRLSIRKDSIMPDNLYREYIDKGGIELTEQMRGLSELVFGVKKCIRDEKGENLEVQICGKLNDYLKMALPKMAAASQKYFPRSAEEKEKEESSLIEDSAKKTDPNSSALSLQDPAIFPVLSSLAGRVATYRDQLAAQLATDTKSLQYDLQSYIESSTGIEEDLYTLMMQNQNTKEKLAEERYKVEKAQKKLGSLAIEKEKLEAELNEAQADLTSSEGLLLEETKDFEEVLDKAVRLQLAIQSKKAHIESAKAAANLERSKLAELVEIQLRLEAVFSDEQGVLDSLVADNKALSERLDAIKLARENLRREKQLQQELADDFGRKLQGAPLQASTPEKAIEKHFEGTLQHSPIAPPEGRKTNSPFTGAKESLKQMEQCYAAFPEDKALPASKSPSFEQPRSGSHQLGQRASTEPGDRLARFEADSVTPSNLLSWIGSLLLQAQNLKPAPDRESLEKIERDIFALDASIKRMKSTEDQIEFEYSKKRQQLANLMQEESSLKDNYIKSELKLELTQQKIIQIQAEISRLNGIIEDAKRETDSKRKELMLKTEQVAKFERIKAAEASDSRRIDDELGLDKKMVELLPLKQTGVSEPLLGEQRQVESLPGETLSRQRAAQELTILQLWLSSTVPLVVGYLLIKLGVL